LDRTEKREFVAGLVAALADVSMVVVTQNQGLTVAEATVLRRRMRDAGATFKIAKNRLAHLALEGTRFNGLKPMLKGPTALAWSKDPVAVAKAAVEFAKTNEKLVLIGGALGTQMLDVSGIKALAELPSLETLRAGLLGMLNTPATRLAGVLRPRLASLRGSSGLMPSAMRCWKRCRRRPERSPAHMPEPPAGNSGLQGTNRSLD